MYSSRAFSIKNGKSVDINKIRNLTLKGHLSLRGVYFGTLHLIFLRFFPAQAGSSVKVSSQPSPHIGLDWIVGCFDEGYSTAIKMEEGSVKLKHVSPDDHRSSN